MDAYLQALVRRRPSDLPLASDARFTENGQLIPLDRGLWGTADPEPPFGAAVTVTDPETAQAGFFGSVSEHGQSVLLGLRLATRSPAPKAMASGATEITEIETLVIRGHSRFELFEPASLSQPRTHFDQVVEPSQRASRAELIETANHYFDGIEANDGSIIPIRAGSVRFENGVQTVRKPAPGGSGFAEGGYMEVDAQISSGMFAYIERIRDRRYPVIDVERGLVLGHVFFEHPGLLTSVEVVDRGTVELPRFATEPSSAMIMELFKVEEGQIVAIEALLDFFPFGMRTPWDA